MGEWKHAPNVDGPETARARGDDELDAHGPVAMGLERPVCKSKVESARRFGS
jgi:hypothetical protein